MTMAAAVVKNEPPLYQSWPHPRPPDPVDDRLIKVIERAMIVHQRAQPKATRRQVAVYVANAVWEWLAEGDPSPRA